MRFEITFHGPYRIGTGQAGPGVDETAYPNGRVPASSLKGVMRAAARQLLPLAGERDHDLVRAVFGDRRTHRLDRAPSPWSWTDAEPIGAADVQLKARVARDPDTGTVDQHALAIAQQVWAQHAAFEVLRTGFLDSEAGQQHELLLAASAHAVHALGAERRRGLGWVTIRRLDVPFGPEDVRQLHALRGTATGGGASDA